MITLFSFIGMVYVSGGAATLSLFLWCIFYGWVREIPVKYSYLGLFLSFALWPIVVYEALKYDY